MKKSLIAGAASLALAALPVVSTFAATSVIDTINVTVNDETCTFNRTAGEGTYNTTIIPGNFVENFGSSTFTTTCNDPTDIQNVSITASFTALTDGDTTNDILYSANAVDGSASTWRATLGDLSATATPLSEGDSILTAGTESTSATVWYSVSAKAGHNPGTYKGYATYTLAEN